MKYSTSVGVFVLAVWVSLPLAGFAQDSVFPQTKALDLELEQTKAPLLSLTARVRRAEAATESARKKVAEASAVVRRLDQIDDLLVRVIRQLKPMAKLGPTRGLKPVVANLEKLQTQVHKVRVQGDRVNEKVLKPMTVRLMALELSLEMTTREGDAALKQIDQTRGQIGALRRFVESRGNVGVEVASLETLASGARPAVATVKASVKGVDKASDAVERELKSLAADLSALIATGPALAQLQKDVKPVNDAARELDKALNLRVGVKVLGKQVGFTIREVVEGPGKISDAILGPLEDLAEKALAPVIRSLKLEIQTPRELQAIKGSLDQVTAQLTPLNQSIAPLESSLQNSGLATLQASLVKMQTTTTGQLASR